MSTDQHVQDLKRGAGGPQKSERAENVREGQFIERGGYKGIVVKIVCHHRSLGDGSVDWYTLRIQPFGMPFSDTCGPLRADTEIMVHAVEALDA